MDKPPIDSKWIWHPQWVDSAKDSAGGFVHFRKELTLDRVPSEPVIVQITADTKYQLYINGRLTIFGPVKGDEHMWFYDELDIGPYLKSGVNILSVQVLRLYHGTPYGTSFPRMPFPGLLVRRAGEADGDEIQLDTDDTWLVAIDASRKLRIDQKEDDFLHVYEDAATIPRHDLDWVAAQVLDLPKSHGLGPPWMLHPRMIPLPRITPTGFKKAHNVRSSLSQQEWEGLLLNPHAGVPPLRLPAGTTHHIELEADHHLTTYLEFCFERPTSSGSELRITYAECYEDEPEMVPYIRRKGDRLDTTKKLYGPQDRYVFAGEQGCESAQSLQYTMSPKTKENFRPFHFRTFRILALDIQVNPESDLVMTGVRVNRTHYPLDVTGEVEIPGTAYEQLWFTSVRTLTNCMHDCYEDCPFYEQLQYAMDVRSSCLFTYYVSGDDRMARQAILQLHSSYRSHLGLLASRSPASQLQIIPHFSLFWILTLVDHFEHFGDTEFTRRLIPVCDGILESFAGRIEPALGLVSSETPFWDFVDWTPEWKPMGIPPAAARTGYQTFTNSLYAHTMQRLVPVVKAIGRQGLAGELEARADTIVGALRQHCRLGEVFTDGLASSADITRDFSQHNQIWAVLCGAATGDYARKLLRQSLPMAQSMSSEEEDLQAPIPATEFTKPSQAMSFYLLRSLSVAGSTLYDDVFHDMWQPWLSQLSLNLTTWCEDEVTLRSDCHAWSCVPLYELMAEVAGIRPAEPGWSSVSFRPRTGLFPSFRAKVPLGGKLAPGTAHVAWKRSEGWDKASVSLRLETGAPVDGVPIHVTYPDGRQETKLGLELTFTL
ncbi:hypothetical protein FALCPG4_007710 [Fusarium falciforme]